jgi:hypothetical protein
MSEAFTATVKALGDDPELRARVMSARSADERAGILRESGVSVPSHADVNSGVSNLADVAGAGTGKSKGGTDPIVTDGMIASAAAGAAGA